MNRFQWDWVSCEGAEDPHVKVVMASDPGDTIAVIPIRDGNVAEAEEEAMEFVSRHNAQVQSA